MKNNAQKSAFGTIFRKEFARFWGDKRVVVSTILLPGLLIYLLYSLMGNALQSNFSVDGQDPLPVAVVNMPEDLQAQLQPEAEAAGLRWQPQSPEDAEDARAAVRDQQLALCAIFPADFALAVEGYDIASGQAAPAVEIYFNSASTDSAAAYQRLVALLDGYESTLANKFDLNAGAGPYDLATAEDTTASVFSSMLPMLLMIFMFSGCMAVAPESIAGEKERGTIAALLITPAPRSHIVFGKVAALCLISLLSGISSAVGTVLSLPKLMGAAEQGLSGSVYGPLQYLQLGCIIFSTMLLLVTVISIVSAFARTVKEASTYVSPLMILSMGVGITALFGGGANQSVGFYLIPLYNSVQCMSGIFSFTLLPSGFAVCLAANLVYTALGVVALTRMFHSEKVMFGR